MLHYRMREKRTSAGSAFNPKHGLIITGGWDGSNSLSSAERTRDGRSFEPFTKLPIVLSNHCIVSLDGGNGDFFITGGWSNNIRRKMSYIYRDSAWRQMADWPTARSCKKYIDYLERKNG